eukprot:TRINITY_DN2821_c0_g1_i2.p1 TRINITY_DN2821_c0_g1~~TRINITY_DN2821_c0_g1_i2.p1  ORF type:complete len:470 (+),score=58.69 TRINITY_DN2821_c0_g1_i2:459-1868(+)
MDLKKQNFIDSLLKLPSSNRTEVYTSVEIEQKILFMSDPIPQDRSGRIRWQRLHQRFKIVPYQTTKLLYLKKKENEDNNRDKRILSIEEMYDTILRVHIEHNHVRRDGLHKRLSEEYHGVTEKACVLFLANCEECHLRKAKKSVKSLVVKPISSTRFLSRCQVDLIDFRDMSETHNMADCGIPYKWLLVYQDHFTKYLLLRPLKHKSAVEVADVLEDIFCDLGPPHILQSDNGGEFSNNILFSLLNQKWPSTKIIHGKPRHPESQRSVERANREVKNGLASKMRDNSNDLCWVKYLKRVQFEKNTTFHSTVGMTPYEAVYHHKPSYGLSDFGIPVEYGSEIHTEQELDALIEEINGPISEDNIPVVSPHHISPSTLTTDFPTNGYGRDSVILQEIPNDSFLDDISQPIPDCTHFFGANLSPLSLNCVVCNFETSGTHYCPGCNGFVHVYCGITEGEEGRVWIIRLVQQV